MAVIQEAEATSRKLVDLRVIDLKAELERRGLEKTGVKSALLDRLKVALEDEGKDPEEYMFEDESGGKKDGTTPKKATRGAIQDQAEEDEAEEEESMEVDDGDNTLAKVNGEEGEHEEEPEAANEDKEGSSQRTVAKQTSGGPILKVDDLDAENDPPSPTSVPVVAPFTSKDMATVGNATERKDDDLSLIVHVDDTLNDLDNDILDDVEEGTESATTTDTSNVAAKTAESKAEGEGKPEDKQASSTDTDKKTADVDQSNLEKAKDAVPSGDDKKTPLKSDDKTKSPASKDAKPKPKDTKSEKVNSEMPNLWVSGLSSKTRATDLKTLFSKYGKVSGAKVVTKARTPGARCFGLVTMSTTDEASRCIQHLHRSELHGKMISVEKAKSDAAAAAKQPTKPAAAKEPADKKAAEVKTTPTKRSAGKTVAKSDEKKASDQKKVAEKSDGKKDATKTSEKKGTPKKDGDKKETPKKADKKGDGKEGEKKDAAKKDSSKDKEAAKKDSKKDAPKSASRSKDVKKTDGKEKDVLSFNKITEERERERLRQRERQLREVERQRRSQIQREKVRQAEIARRQQEEEVRLQRERDRLRMERDNLRREQLEMERMEVERLRQEKERRERERMEREREEQRRLAEQRRQAEQRRHVEQTRRLEEQRRATKRTYERGQRDELYSDAKRPALNDRYERDGRPAPRPADSRTPADTRTGDRYEFDNRGGRPAEGRPAASNEYDRRVDRFEGKRPAEPARQPGRYDERREEPRRADERRDQRFVDDRRPAHDSSRDRRGAVPVRREEPSRPAPRDAHSRPYADGAAPSSRDQWAVSQSAGGGQGMARQGDRWPAAGAGVGGRPGMQAQRPIPQPLMGVTPASQNFLASAANIMMGVGLAANRSQEPRFDAYKNMTSPPIRRY